MAKEAIHGVRRDISRKEMTIDGKVYLEIIYEVDFGPKNGVAKVRVLDPFVTEEAQQTRREAIVRKCQELIKRGLM